MTQSAEEQLMYEQFTLEFDSCMCCGINPKRQIDRLFPARWLECAHILGGTGQRKQKGETNRRNLLMLCKLCHDLAHRFNIRKPDKTLLPKLEREHLLWLKQKHDPEYFHLEFLKQVARKSMPEPEQPPEWFQLEYERWRE